MRKINWKELDNYLEDGYYLIDIREENETSFGKHPKAKNIPLSKIKDMSGSIEPPSCPIVSSGVVITFSEDFGGLDRNKKYIFHCASGGRSNILIENLVMQGVFKDEDVIDVIGGFNSYK